MGHTMPKRKTPPRTAEEDRAAFVAAARELGCSEDEAEFDGKLRKLVKAKPVTNKQVKTRRKKK